MRRRGVALKSSAIVVVAAAATCAADASADLRLPRLLLWLGRLRRDQALYRAIMRVRLSYFLVALLFLLFFFFFVCLVFCAARKLLLACYVLARRSVHFVGWFGSQLDDRWTICGKQLVCICALVCFATDLHELSRAGARGCQDLSSWVFSICRLGRSDLCARTCVCVCVDGAPVSCGMDVLKSSSSSTATSACVRACTKHTHARRAQAVGAVIRPPPHERRHLACASTFRAARAFAVSGWLPPPSQCVA